MLRTGAVASAEFSTILPWILFISITFLRRRRWEFSKFSRIHKSRYEKFQSQLFFGIDGRCRLRIFRSNVCIKFEYLWYFIANEIFFTVLYLFKKFVLSAHQLVFIGFGMVSIVAKKQISHRQLRNFGSMIANLNCSIY